MHTTFLGDTASSIGPYLAASTNLISFVIYYLATVSNTTWYIIGGIVFFLILVIVFLRWSAKRSPKAVAQVTQNGITIKVACCRPHKRDRTIFGSVVKYDKVWRTGANAATIIELAQDVRMAGNRLAKGRYSLYTIPTPTDWTVIINRRTGQWGVSYKLILRQAYLWTGVQLIFKDGQFSKSSMHGFEVQATFQGKMIRVGGQSQTL